MKKIQTIIFDLGGVLIDWNPRYLYKQLFDNEADMENFLSTICTPDWNEQQDAGRPLAEATEKLVLKHPQFEPQIRAFYGRWTEMLGGPIQGSVEILKQIHQTEKYPLYALTNWSDELFHHALERYNYLKLFRGILVSGREKMKKPDYRIYRLMLDRFYIIPETTLFIDDSLKNVEGAKVLGIQTIHFQSPEQLKLELENLEIL